MIGKCTHVVDCRETMGMGEGGGIAQRGTFAECGNEVLAIAMSPEGDILPSQFVK